MRTFLAVLLLAASLAGCTSEPSAAPKDASRCAPALEKRLRAWGDAGFSGSIAVSAGGRFECLAAYGTADKATGRRNAVDTVFGIGSVSKAFTAAAILDLAAEGKLALSDRAGELVPGLPGPAADATVRQLLLHTSGLTGSHGADHVPLGRAAAIAAMGRLKRAHPPGRRFLYSNAGYSLLALIVDERSGMSYREFMVARILRLPGGRQAGGFWDGDPAAPGPRAVGYLEEGRTEQMGDFAGPHWALDGNGDLAMTMRDLASWTRALFTDKIIPRGAVAKIVRGGFATGGGQRETAGWVRYGRQTYGVPFFISAGGGGDVGHDAVIAWVPAGKRAIAIASNTPTVSAEQLMQAVGPALIAGKPIPLPKGPARAVDPGALRAAAGTYRLPSGGSFRVSAAKDGLSVAARGADAVEAVFPLPAGVTRRMVRAGERRALALLTRDTAERRQLESAYGPIERVRVAGTMVSGSDVRTYVEIATRSRRLLGWYAVDEAGAIDAASVPAEPPASTLLPAGRGRYVPRDPTGRSPDPTVRIEGDRLTVEGPGGRVAAKR